MINKKFRLWDYDNNSMSYIDFDNLSKTIETLDSFRDYFSSRYFTYGNFMMMSSNETDNHGNELYEGDIVQTWCYNRLQTHIIEWTREGFKAGGYHLDSIYFKGGGDDFKVIGNIFQNPELTKR